MEKRAIRRTFKTALRDIRRNNCQISMQELGLRIDSDASHIFKLEHGHDVTLSTVLKLAAALGVEVSFGNYILTADPEVKTRKK